MTGFFDGLSQIAGLQPLQVVDVTYTHGYQDVPDDVKYMATEVVVGVLGLGATGPIRSFTVGDVSEVYAVRGDNVAAVVVLSNRVLDRYTNEDVTYRLGAGHYPDEMTSIPTL